MPAKKNSPSKPRRTRHAPVTARADYNVEELARAGAQVDIREYIAA